MSSRNRRRDKFEHKERLRGAALQPARLTAQAKDGTQKRHSPDFILSTPKPPNWADIVNQPEAGPCEFCIPLTCVPVE